ncbi:hypothetical protein CVT24_003719 [Panaeolus cyanescens]|uniref:Uncharacterized protein n=1 Tax=Panaeolus cyanescens TaxID=181874 RepID=A0A409YXP8_9AGAR|nr:hypothetical protein CVT24_003719 [Panaeolus cyanescens]
MIAQRDSDLVSLFTSSVVWLVNTAPNANMEFVRVYWIEVEGQMLWAKSDFFMAMHPRKRAALGLHSGKGSQTDPIRLGINFNVAQIKAFIEVFGKLQVSRQQSSQTLSLSKVLLSGRIARALHMEHFVMWLRDGFCMHGAHTAGENSNFVATVYRENALIYPMDFWCQLMIVNGVLPPIKALLFAKKRYIPEILGAAAYRILCIGGPKHEKLNAEDRMYISSVLSKHIRCGYHSLQTTWAILGRNVSMLIAPETDELSKHDHETCVGFWEYAWDELDQACDFPPYALVERYREFESKLDKSVFADECCRDCWKRGVSAISARRSSLVRSLHHHFDF